MKKNDFLEIVKEKGGYSSMTEAGRAVKAFTDAIEEGLKERKGISLVGFGKFEAVKVPEKRGKVPGTDKEYVKPEHYAPRFKAGAALKSAVAE